MVSPIEEANDCPPIDLSGKHRKSSKETPPTTKVRLHSQELIGSDKEFRITTNYIHLKIIGNNNRLFIRKNKSTIQIVGNCVKVQIIKNYADVQYVGNCGRVYMGRASPNTNLQYTGCAGKLKLITEDMFNDKNFSDPKKTDGKKSPTSDSQPRSFSLAYTEKGSEDFNKSDAPDDDIPNGVFSRLSGLWKNPFIQSTDELKPPVTPTTIDQCCGKLNISLPNLSLVLDTSNNHLDNTKNLRISCSTTNIDINSFYHVS